MLLTILTGHVAKENRELLKERFARELHNPPQDLLQTFLIQSEDDPHCWQIISLWRNLEAYEKEHSGKIMEACVQMFCDAGSTPDRTIFHVTEHYTRV
ncbi:hypothetical protein [Longilinea arvoryzae]|nr:hypothetical protein [Longilinea arvoryzae]